jgi:hypothetical protein
MDELLAVEREQAEAHIAMIAPDTSPEDRKIAATKVVMTPLSMLSVAARCLRVVQ